jgi:hypothetical protein
MATSKKMGRPATGTGTPVQVRCPPELLAAIDKERERIMRERPGVGEISRGAVIRELLGRMLLGPVAKAKAPYPSRY